MNKKAFTLMEMAIVIIIIAILVGTYMDAGKSAIQNSKISSTKTTLEEIKTNLISYASIHGNLPSSNNGTAIETLPYDDIGSKSKDSFGMSFDYEVNPDFVFTTKDTICTVLSSLDNTLDFPQMLDENSVSKYAVVAVIISKGVDKILNGENDDYNTPDSKYTMSTNSYNESQDDLVVELTYYELMSNICDISMEDYPIVFNGQIYKQVVSSETGEIWLDRNLGADRVCEAIDDDACYGDYYQWGRKTNGHEESDSDTTSTQIDVDVESGGEFIIGNENWRSSSDNTLWDGISAINNPCPSGYRVPINNEILNENFSNKDDAINSVMKIPASGRRANTDGSLGVLGTTTYLWSATIDGSYAKANILDNDDNDENYSAFRAYGFPVRCIKD